MDPLSIIASVVAIAQAGDSLIKLMPQIRAYFNAPQQIDQLINEISGLRLVLDTIHKAAWKLPTKSIVCLRIPLESCYLAVVELDRLLKEFLRTPANVHRSLQIQIYRVRWVHGKSKVEGLQRQLRDAKSTLILSLLAINPAILGQNRITNNVVCDSLQVYRDSDTQTYFCAEPIDEDYGDLIAANDLGNLRRHGSGAGDDKGSPGSSLEPQLPIKEVHSSPVPSCSFSEVPPIPKLSQCESAGGSEILKPGSEPSEQQVSRTIGTGQLGRKACVTECQCSCHRRASMQLHLLNGHLGSLIITCTGNPFKSIKCDQPSCTQRCTPRLLLSFYIRQWFALRAISFAFSNGGRPHIALSFPRLVPAEAEFFGCIRTGKSERIMELLSNGEASVADIMAPYGLTPLALAIMYDQVEVCRLLAQAGAQLLAPNYTWCRSDVSNYVAKFSLLESSFTVGSLVQDYVRICAPGLQINAMKSYYLESSLGSHNYTRLHKSVLGLSSESVDEIARISRTSINETDSIGRTALYWSSYLGDSRAIDVLLGCGADPNLADHCGLTPLHAAAALGSVACTNALIQKGADLEPRDRFGATPLHYASAHGHMGVIEIFLHEVDGCEAEDYFGETPVTYAIFGRRPCVIERFLEIASILQHVDEWGYTPVLDAVLEDSHEVLELLLRLENADTNAKLRDDKTLLHVAALNSDLRTIEILRNSRLLNTETAAADAAGYTAMDYIRQRKDSNYLIESFDALLRSIEARATNQKGDNIIFDCSPSEDDDEILAEIYDDALEHQIMT